MAKTLARCLVAVWMVLLCACDGGGGGGSALTVDPNYNFAAAGVLPGSTTRSPGRARILGLVTDAAGKPAVGVTVSISRLVTVARGVGRQAGVGSAATVTGDDGRYTFGDVPPGNYRVQMEQSTIDVAAVANADVSHDFAGATSGTSGGPLPPPRYQWTIMVYLDADNDLEAYGTADVNEMEMLPDSNDVKIVVLMDRNGRYDSSNGGWRDARRFVVRHDTDPEIMTSALTPADGGQAEVMGELDMGSATTLRSFTDWAMRHYPAQHYLLDLWNHGSGWRPVGRTQADRGILFDDTNRNYLRTHQMAGALVAPARFDLITMDCSLMQMAEVVHEIRNTCDFLCGSEESPPGEGYPYNLTLAPAFDNPSITPEAWGREIVNRYVSDVGQRSHVTQSCFRTARIAALTASIDAYAKALLPLVSAYRDQLKTIQAATQHYGGTNALYGGNRDLVDFIDRVAAATSNAALIAAGQAVKNDLAAALVAEGHAGWDMTDSHGLAIFVPANNDWPALRSAYLQTAFAQDTAWDEWLDALWPSAP